MIPASASEGHVIALPPNLMPAGFYAITPQEFGVAIVVTLPDGDVTLIGYWEDSLEKAEVTLPAETELQVIS